MNRKACTKRKVTLEEVACLYDDGKLRSLAGVKTVEALDKPIPAEAEFYRRVPIACDLGQPSVFLWYCTHFPQVRFRTAQEAAMLCTCEGYTREGKMFVEVYEFVVGTRRRSPSLEWVYQVEMCPITAEPLSEMLDRARCPIEE